MNTVADYLEPLNTHLLLAGVQDQELCALRSVFCAGFEAGVQATVDVAIVAGDDLAMGEELMRTLLDENHRMATDPCAGAANSRPEATALGD